MSRLTSWKDWLRALMIVQEMLWYEHPLAYHASVRAGPLNLCCNVVYQFVCQERFVPPPSSPETNLSSSVISLAHSSSTFTSSCSSTGLSSAVSRKRILWAHSNILKARSPYFRALFSDSFSEGARVSIGGRKVFVLDLTKTDTASAAGGADFASLYSLLKFIYTNTVEFE